MTRRSGTARERRGVRCGGAAGRRGFALPLVIAITVVCAILIAAMLEQAGSQRFYVQRQLDAYTDHHSGKGLQEAVQSWLNAQGTTPIRDALAEDGLAFTLEVAAGQVIEVRFVEAQGTLLANFAGLSGEDVGRAAAAVDALGTALGPRAREYVRTEGPLGVSVQSAPREVIEAIANGICGGSKGQEVAREVLAARERPGLTPATLAEALSRVNLEAQERFSLQRLYTAAPVLWFVEARARPTGQGVALGGSEVRYGGLALVASGRQGRESGSVQRTTSFLTWTRLREGEVPQGMPVWALTAQPDR